MKWRWTREEEFLCSSTRAPWHMELATAVTKDGWILGQKMLTLHDSGAYARFSPYGLTKHSFHHTGAYSIPNLHFDGYVVFTNRTPTTAMRGFGVTSVSFAVETHLNRIANELGIDQVEIRMKNANRIGDTSPNGIAYTDPSTIDTLKAHRRRDRPRAAGGLPHDDERAPVRRAAPRASRRPGRIHGGSLMAKHTGRGIAAIEYPTGMNQNGDPSQCWIKVKPDGRVDVFAGTADIGNGSKTIQSQIVAETIGVPYDWITYDNSNTDSSPVCTGTFASRATFVAGKAAEKAALQVKQKILEIAGKEMEIDPADLEIVDGEVIAKGAPQTKLGVGDVAAAATWGHGELITGTGAQLKPYAAIIDPETGEVDLPPHSAISYASCAAEVEVDDETGEVRVTRLQQCYDVGRALNPSLGRGADRGRRDDGPRARHPRELLPVLPVGRPPRRLVRLLPRAGHGGHAADRHDHDREPLRRRAVRREGDRRDGEQPAAAGDRRGGVRRGRRVGHRAADHAGARAPRARGEGGADARGQEGRVRRGALRERGLVGRDAVRGPGLTSPFRTWNGVDRHTLFPGVAIHAIGGEQVMICHVEYAPGTRVARHSHPTAEQVMWIVDGRRDDDGRRRDEDARRG